MALIKRLTVCIMEHDSSQPGAPLVDAVEDATQALTAVRNLETCRRNTGALRTMFGTCIADPKPAMASVAKPDGGVPKQRPNSSALMPHI